MSRSRPRRSTLSSPLRSSITRHFRKSAAEAIEHALGFEAVAAGAARLLLVVLERLRRAGVQHEPHVGSIDAHAERDRRDDDVDVLVEERVLIAMPLLVGQPGVIGDGAIALLAQPRGEIVDLAPRQTVDDAGLVAMAREHVEDLTLEIRARQHAVDEVRPIERSDELERIDAGRAATRCRAARARSRSR